MWADLTRADATRRYEHDPVAAAGRGLAGLPGDSERGTLTRLPRAAQLASHDTGDLLGRAINSGEWELTWVDGSTSPSALRRYYLKA